MRFRLAMFVGLFLLLTTPHASMAQEPEISGTPGPAAHNVVRGVFFFSPTCPHCEQVIANDLPGIFDAAGGAPSVTFDETVPPEDLAFYLMSNGSLQLLMVDASARAGAEMFSADSDRLGLTTPGVPRLDIDGSFHVGSVDIPAELLDIIAAGVAADGVGWPAVPGLEDALAPFGDSASGSVANQPSGDQGDEDAAAALPASLEESALDRIGRDPVGNGISIVVLVALVGSLIAVPFLVVRGRLRSGPGWLLPLLIVVGLGVAAYLATIETTGSAAVCGPVGDCNAVQTSEYASVFGVPIGVLGVAGYVIIGGLWAVSRVAHERMADWALVGMAAGALVGTLFSAYLTFLEPFVIGATCMWCISSALVMLALLWATADDGWAALGRIRGGTGSPGHAAGGQTTTSAATGR